MNDDVAFPLERSYATQKRETVVLYIFHPRYKFMYVHTYRKDKQWRNKDSFNVKFININILYKYTHTHPQKQHEYIDKLSIMS